MRPIQPIQPVYKTTNHLLHLVLSILTVGIWLFVWPLVWIVNEVSNNKSKRLYEEALASYSEAMEYYERAVDASLSRHPANRRPLAF